MAPSLYKQTRLLLTKTGLLFYLAVILFTHSGCKKFLDQKPNKSDVIPSTLNDLQALLNNATFSINAQGTGGYSELIADNIYVTTSTWQNFSSSTIVVNKSETQNYIWGDLPHDNYWSAPYSGPVYYSNIVLDQLPLVNTSTAEEEKYNHLKGSALFYRAFAFNELVQLFCKPYSNEHVNEPGIVLRLTSNINQKSGRATIQQTYDRIINDIKEAAELLPLTSAFATQPTKTAAYAALARVYLLMRDYTNAGKLANQALKQYNALIDYNTLVPLGNPPIRTLNPEVIFHNYSPSYVLLSAANHKIDSQLYKSYDPNDLRKTVFFRANTGVNAGTYVFQGSYNGTGGASSVFDGLATDELYLISAECYARAGNKDAALADLNSLMIKRWSNNGTWKAFTANTAAEALSLVLTERRKELVFRGLRWSDIRRLNEEGANITLQRIIAGTTYTLPARDARTVMLISQSEINNNPAIDQNPR